MDLTFRQPKPLDVDLRWDDGASAAGIRLGGGPQALPPRAWHSIVTNATGRARLFPMRDELDEEPWIWKLDGSSWYLPPPTPAADDRVLRIVLNRPVEVTLRVTLDGERRLPADLHLDGSEYLVGKLVEDPREATLTFRFWQRTRWWPTDVVLHGRGFSQVHLAISAPPGSHLVRDVALFTGATLEIVSPREPDRLRSNDGTTLAKHGPTRTQGSKRPSLGPTQVRPWSSGTCFPGIHRLSGRGCVSRTFEVDARASVQRVAIDLTTSSWIRGRVEGPEGISPSLAFVVPLGPGDPAEPDEAFMRMNRVPVNEHGWFDFSRFGTNPIRLVPWHPAASPESAEPVAAGKWNAENVLRLAPPRRSVRFTTDLVFPPEFATRGTIRLLQLDDAGKIPSRSEAALVDGRFQAAHCRAGVSTLVLDPPSELVILRENEAPQVLRLPARAPLVLPGVRLDEANVDLGRLEFAAASTLVLRFADWPQPVPPLAVTVEALEEPRYVRTLTTSGETEARISGLRKGRFLVRIEQREVYSYRFEREVVADGQRPVEIQVDSPLPESRPSGSPR